MVHDELNLLNLPDAVLGLIIDQIKLHTSEQLQRIMVVQDNEVSFANSLNNLSQTCWQLRGLVQINKLTYKQAYLALLPRRLCTIDRDLPHAKLVIRGLMVLLIYYLLWIIPIRSINSYFMKKLQQDNLLDYIYLILLLLPIIVFGCYLRAINKSLKLTNIINNHNGFFQQTVYKFEAVKQLKTMCQLFSPSTIESGMRSPLLRNIDTPS